MVLPDVGALVKFMHIVEESHLACSLVSVDYRVDVLIAKLVLICAHRYLKSHFSYPIH